MIFLQTKTKNLIAIFALLSSFAATSRNINQQFLIDLSYQFAPELRLHPKEKFKVGNIAQFIESARLISNYDQGKKLVIPEYKIDLLAKSPFNLLQQKILVDDQWRLSSSKNPQSKILDRLWLALPKKGFWDVAKAKDMERICYAYPKYLADEDMIEINYIFFYPYNGPAKSKLPLTNYLLKKLNIGSHEGDIEHISVRLNADGTNIEGIFFAAHGSDEGRWHYQEKLDDEAKHGFKLKNGRRPIAWSALDTHATYNRVGAIKRPAGGALAPIVETFGILVDYTKNGGEIIDCQKSLEIIDPQNPLSSQPWLSYRGKFGYFAKGTFTNDGPKGIFFKSFFEKEKGF